MRVAVDALVANKILARAYISIEKIRRPLPEYGGRQLDTGHKTLSLHLVARSGTPFRPEQGSSETAARLCVLHLKSTFSQVENLNSVPPDLR